jgi:hypothetical protein
MIEDLRSGLSGNLLKIPLVFPHLTKILLF